MSNNAPAKLIPTLKIRPPSLADPHPKMVTVNVGTDPTAKKFTVHANFLKHYSPYFAKMLSPPNREAEEGIINLPEVKPAAFGLFVLWLYTRVLTEPFNEPANVNDLIDLWFLAERAEAPSLQNEVIKAINIHPSKAEMLSTQNFRAIYAETTKKSLMCRFLVTSICRYLDPIDVPENVPKEMLVDVFATLRRSYKMRGRPGELMSDKMVKNFLVKIPGGNDDDKENRDGELA